MVRLIFKQASGHEDIVETQRGLSVMEAAVKNNISGIDADCGGGCSCATCHVYIDDSFLDKVGKPSVAEEDMLDFAFDVRSQSRLCCQIRITEDMDNMIVHVPTQS
jgi:2Fe-2S ferredoxin